MTLRKQENVKFWITILGVLVMVFGGGISYSKLQSGQTNNRELVDKVEAGSADNARRIAALEAVIAELRSEMKWQNQTLRRVEDMVERLVNRREGG